MREISNTRGFTLIELMTVVVIISILAAIALPNFMNASIRAKVARSRAEQELLVWALESYYTDRDAYPPNLQVGKPSLGDLSPITTPVAYISSVPEDIFLAPGDVDRKEFVKTERAGNPFYFYVNFIQATDQRMPLAPYGHGGSANFIVYGMGPLHSTGFAPMNPETLVEYSPSNGTSSHGHIVTFGP